MAILFAIISVLGLAGLIYGLMQKSKAGRMSDAPHVRTGEAVSKGPAVANPKGVLSVEGNLQCQQPIFSPITGTPCVYYEVSVIANWKEGDTRKVGTVTKDKRSAQFTVDDGTGPIWIDTSQGGDFDPLVQKKETKGAGLKGLTGNITFGNLTVPTSFEQPGGTRGIIPIGADYTATESIMPVTPRAYVLGKVAQGQITTPGWRSLIVSSKSRDELLASTLKSAKTSMTVGGVAFALGAIGAAVAQLFFSSPASTDSTTVAAASASAAPSVVTTVQAIAAATSEPGHANTPSKKAAQPASSSKTTTTSTSAAPATTSAAPATTSTAPAGKSTSAPAGKNNTPAKKH